MKSHRSLLFAVAVATRLLESSTWAANDAATAADAIAAADAPAPADAPPDEASQEIIVAGTREVGLKPLDNPAPLFQI